MIESWNLSVGGSVQVSFFGHQIVEEDDTERGERKRVQIVRRIDLLIANRLSWAHVRPYRFSTEPLSSL